MESWCILDGSRGQRIRPLTCAGGWGRGVGKRSAGAFARQRHRPQSRQSALRVKDRPTAATQQHAFRRESFRGL